jgi:hypothetical protein
LAYLNSTFISFIIETLGNKSLGLGVLDFFMADFLNLRLPVILNDELAAAFDAISTRPINNVFNEYGKLLRDGEISLEVKQDRSKIDDLIFDSMGLTKGEKDAVYEDFIRMVDTRIRKASSLDINRTAKELSEMEW